jgi:Ca2+-binding RTX toxin-like protein
MTRNSTPARTSRRRLLVSAALSAGIGACLVALGAPPASASTARVYVGSGQVDYQASPGEANDVTVTQTSPTSVTIVDSGATIAPSTGCTGGGSTVTCSDVDGINSVYLYLDDGDDSAVVDVAKTSGVIGGDGDDTLTSVQGSAQLYGQAGDDTLTGSAAVDYLDTGAGVDIASAGAGNDTVATSGTGDHTVNLGPGDDTANIGAGDDDVQGGSGVDSVSYIGFFMQWQSSEDVAVSLDDVADDGASAIGEVDNVHSDVESVTTGNGDDTISGTASRNIIASNGGDDVVVAAGGRDRVVGGPGDDELSGGADGDRLEGDAGNDVVNGGGDDDYLDGSDSLGADSLNGGDGVDLVTFERIYDVSVTLNDQADDGEAGEGDNVGSDVEDVIAGDGDDTIIGSAVANDLSGGAGNDTIRSGGGNDGLDGGLGRDALGGGPGVDSMAGGGNVDTLKSQDTGRSADYVTCGSSVDAVNRDAHDQVAVDCELLS